MVLAIVGMNIDADIITFAVFGGSQYVYTSPAVTDAGEHRRQHKVTSMLREHH